MPHLKIRSEAPTPEELAALTPQRDEDQPCLWLDDLLGVLVYARPSPSGLGFCAYREIDDSNVLKGRVGASVAVYRPRFKYDDTVAPAYVNHSSSSSNDTGAHAAQVTVELLQLAIATARAMDVLDAPRIEAERAEYAQRRAEQEQRAESDRVHAVSLYEMLGGNGCRVRVTTEGVYSWTGRIEPYDGTAALTIGGRRASARSITKLEIKGGMGGPYAPYVTVYNADGEVN